MAALVLALSEVLALGLQSPKALMENQLHMYCMHHGRIYVRTMLVHQVTKKVTAIMKEGLSSPNGGLRSP